MAHIFAVVPTTLALGMGRGFGGDPHLITTFQCDMGCIAGYGLGGVDSRIRGDQREAQLIIQLGKAVINFTATVEVNLSIQ